MEINNVRIRAAAVAIHGKIRSMQKKKGYCWASNAAIADMIGISKSYVSHSITDLVRSGLVCRQLMKDPATGEIIGRRLVAFEKAEETAAQIELIKKMEGDQSAAGTRARLLNNGKNLCIAPRIIVSAIEKYGAEKVDTALAIVKASLSCRSPIRLFYAALKGGYEAGKRAARWIGRAFPDAQRRKYVEAEEEEEKHEVAQDSPFYKFLRSAT